MDQEQLRKVILAHRYEWRKHAIQRLAERNILQAVVVDVLCSGTQIEDYPQSVPYPSALFLGWKGETPLHVVAAIDIVNSWAYIITAYEPDLNRFEPDYKTPRGKK